MNDPLINPWLIYLIGISENISWIFNFTFGVALIFFLISIVAGFCFTTSIAADAENIKTFWKINVKILILTGSISLISLIMSAFIPAQKWLIALAVNSQINPNNLSVGAEISKDVYKQFRNDFFGLVDKVTDTEKTNKEDKK